MDENGKKKVIIDPETNPHARRVLDQIKKQKRKRVLEKIRKYTPLALAVVSTAASTYLAYRNQQLRAENDELQYDRQDNDMLKKAWTVMSKTGNPQSFIDHHGNPLFTMVPYDKNLHRDGVVEIEQQDAEEKEEES